MTAVISLNVLQRQVLRHYLQRVNPGQIFFGTMKALRAGRATEILFDDLRIIVDLLGEPLGNQLIADLRMAEIALPGRVEVVGG